MTTEQKLLDEVIELLDLLASNTDSAINSDVIWSGNDPTPGVTTSSELIRFKLNRLKNNKTIVNKKFQLHFANLSKTTQQITDIKI